MVMTREEGAKKHSEVASMRAPRGIRASAEQAPPPTAADPASRVDRDAGRAARMARPGVLAIRGGLALVGEIGEIAAFPAPRRVRYDRRECLDEEGGPWTTVP